MAGRVAAWLRRSRLRIAINLVALTGWGATLAVVRGESFLATMAWIAPLWASGALIGFWARRYRRRAQR